MILGIDPGTLRLGWAIVQRGQCGRLSLMSAGCCVAKKLPLPERLAFFYEELDGLIGKYRPKAMVLEKAFVAKNPTSSLVLGAIRGVCLTLAGQHLLMVQECSATSAKKAFTGHGHTSKENMMAMAHRRFGVALPADAADAVALAFSWKNPFYENPSQTKSKR